MLRATPGTPCRKRAAVGGGHPPKPLAGSAFSRKGYRRRLSRARRRPAPMAQTPQHTRLAASVKPYARATIEAARYAAPEGVPVMALTDSEVSPLAQVASAVILVATESPSFFHTMTPLLAVTEILAALIAGRSGQKALDALARTEAQLAAFGVHLP